MWETIKVWIGGISFVCISMLGVLALGLSIYSYYKDIPYCIGNFDTEDKVILREAIKNLESIQNGVGRK